MLCRRADAFEARQAATDADARPETVTPTDPTRVAEITASRGAAVAGATVVSTSTVTHCAGAGTGLARARVLGTAEAVSFGVVVAVAVRGAVSPAARPAGLSFRTLVDWSDTGRAAAGRHRPVGVTGTTNGAAFSTVPSGLAIDGDDSRCVPPVSFTADCRLGCP